MSISKSLTFDKNDTVANITLKLNQILEEMILRNIDQWIWTHNKVEKIKIIYCLFL